MTFKHHEYIDDLDIRDTRREYYYRLYYNETNKQKYDSLFSLDDRPESSGIQPGTKCFVSYTKHFPYDFVSIRYKNLFKESLSARVPFDKMIKIIESFASFYSLNNSYKKNGELEDPVTIFYNAGIYYVVLGHHRFFYCKVMGIPLKATVYTFDPYGDIVMAKDIDDLQWDVPITQEQVYLKPILGYRGTDMYGFLRLCLAYDKSRDDIMLKHKQDMEQFVEKFNSTAEEVIYYYRGKVALFLPSVNPLVTKEVEIEDEWGVIQHCLYRYCNVKKFEMSWRFKEL